MSILLNKNKFITIFLLFTVMLTACSKSPSQSLNEKIFQEYVENNRVEKYHELYERYDGIKVILWLNAKKDRWWITNFTLWCIFSILPDLPEALAGGGVIAIIYAIAWWIGVTLTGGGILAVLAWLGKILGGIPGIPPAIMGIVYLCAMYAVLLKVFNLLF